MVPTGYYWISFEPDPVRLVVSNPNEAFRRFVRRFESNDGPFVNSVRMRCGHGGGGEGTVDPMVRYV